MKVYFLTRSSRPAIQDGQMKTVLLCLEPTGTKKTLDQLVKECLSRNYAMTFKRVHEGDDLLKFTADSILYHLDRMGSLIGTDEGTGAAPPGPCGGDSSLVSGARDRSPS